MGRGIATSLFRSVTDRLAIVPGPGLPPRAGQANLRYLDSTGKLQVSEDGGAYADIGGGGGGLPTGLTLTGSEAAGYTLNQGTPAQTVGDKQLELFNVTDGAGAALVGEIKTLGDNFGGFVDFVQRRLRSQTGITIGGLNDPEVDEATSSVIQLSSGDGAGVTTVVSLLSQEGMGESYAVLSVDRGATPTGLMITQASPLIPIPTDVGGGLKIETAPGGVASGATVGGVGGLFQIDGGPGGDAAAGSGAGGAGASIHLRAGAGGDGTTTGFPGAGGDLTIQAGSRGAVGGAGDGGLDFGGTVTIGGNFTSAITIGATNTGAITLGNVTSSVTDILGALGANLIKTNWAFGG